MSALPGLLTLLAITLAWVALPLLPAIRELLAPTDVEPLDMVGRDNADVGRFARHLREYLHAAVPRDIETAPIADGRDFIEMRLSDATPCLMVPAAPGQPPIRALPGAADRQVVIVDRPLELEPGKVFRHEVWCRVPYRGSANTTYRALLGERRLWLGPRSTVTRWVHAVEGLEVGDEARLHGRTSSDGVVRLGRGVYFERIGAPVIVVGDQVPAGPSPIRTVLPRCELPAERTRALGALRRVEGDLVIPAGTEVDGDLVVAGALTIGAGARVRGSVKAHTAVATGAGAVVEGSLVSRTDVTLGDLAWVRGPVIAEGALSLGRGATIGTATAQITASAREVQLADGSMVCGHLVTVEGGTTAS